MEKILSYVQGMPSAVRSAYFSILMFLAALVLIFIMEYHSYSTPSTTIKSYRVTESREFTSVN